MTSLRHIKQYDEPQPSQDGHVNDAVLALLAQTEAKYRTVREEWEQQSVEAKADHERQSSELHHAKQALASAQASVQQLAARLEESQRTIETERQELARQRRQTVRQQERANALAALLHDLHRSLYSGDLYSMILRTCLTLTGGTRGLYVTTRGVERTMRVRAAVGIEGYPQAAPSPYIKALCAKAVNDNRTYVCNEGDDTGDLVAPSNPAEQFRNCLVASVVLLKNFDGFLIVADRAQGEFDDDDLQTLLSVGDEAGVAVQNLQLQRELQNAYLSTVSVLADAVEAKDAYTQGHCELVSRYARLTAERLELPVYNRSIVCYAALLHDVGKIGVSDGVLNKPGTLTPEELELVRSHVRVGHGLLSHVTALDEVANVVLHHHEWWNGAGYPDGLVGENIPLASRIIGVVDAYCAMTTRRPYKEAWSDERAREELQRNAGTQFDPQVVEAFLHILDLPEATDQDDDMEAECGLLPAFATLALQQK
jgi:HD-GYP domain-containing protein (c-di-GMP phosphodiesterase class II)